MHAIGGSIVVIVGLPVVQKSHFSVFHPDIAELDPEHNAKDQNIDLLCTDSERTLATILITNNFVNDHYHAVQLHFCFDD